MEKIVVPYKDPNDPRKRSANKRYKNKNLEKIRENSRDNRAEVRAINRSIIKQIKNEIPCHDCGVQYPYYVMDFDHMDPDLKSYNISDMIKTHTTAKLIEEIEKCQVVCANCHRERTYLRSVFGNDCFLEEDLTFFSKNTFSKNTKKLNVKSKKKETYSKKIQ